MFIHGDDGITHQSNIPGATQRKEKKNCCWFKVIVQQTRWKSVTKKHIVANKWIVCKHIKYTSTSAQEHAALKFIETPCKVDLRGLNVDVENYCSDSTTHCTIKTQACGLGAGIFISCGQQTVNSYRHPDRIQNLKRHLLSTQKNIQFLLILIHFFHVPRPYTSLLNKTSKLKVKDNFEEEANKTRN